ncbi:hypothetical protein F5141DRAFT_1063051 [Pisolithus sp. B1]|nr:hypothetical protein F5141DRAFT_1063051 [Pisolithus sp. B1]
MLVIYQNACHLECLLISNPFPPTLYNRIGPSDHYCPWFPWFDLFFDRRWLPNFDVDTNIPMPPLPKDVTLLGKFPTHGNHTWEEVLALAVEEYQTSNIQPAVSKAVKAIFYDCNGNMDGLCEGVIKVVVENRMSNKLLMRPVASSA